MDGKREVHATVQWRIYLSVRLCHFFNLVRSCFHDLAYPNSSISLAILSCITLFLVTSSNSSRMLVSPYTLTRAPVSPRCSKPWLALHSYVVHSIPAFKRFTCTQRIFPKQFQTTSASGLAQPSFNAHEMNAHLV